MHTPLNWFITGAGRGFGRAFATAALDRGDRVTATARDVSALAPLVDRFGDRVVPVVLDVTDEAAVRRAVPDAAAALGSLDVVVNNAGYGQFGAVEELATAELRAQLETNVFGPLWVSQAALPILREQGAGHLLQISSVGGIGAFANLGAYHASKWALEALSESLSIEAARFGVRVTIVEPGGYGTDWAGASARRSAPLDPYDPMREEAAARRGGQVSGDPARAAQALLRIVDLGPEAPLRVVLGEQALDIAAGIARRRIETWEASRAISASA